MTYNDINKELQNQINQVEQLITQAKLELKSWANQISKYHKTLKELTNQLNSLKSQLTMNQPKTKPTKSIK